MTCELYVNEVTPHIMQVSSFYICHMTPPAVKIQGFFARERGNLLHSGTSFEVPTNKVCRWDKGKLSMVSHNPSLYTTIDTEILSTCMHMDDTGHWKVVMTPLLSHQLKLDLGDSCGGIEALWARACAWTFTKMNTYDQKRGEESTDS